jgi:adenosylcobalamin-dependent ribonucleoside-triphosphate reductase
MEGSPTTSSIVSTPINSVSKTSQHRVSKKEDQVFVIRDENRFRLDPAFVANYVDKQPPWGFGLLSRIIYERTYARPVSKKLLKEQAMLYRGMSEQAADEYAKKSKQTHEQYWQTVLRVVEGVSSILKQQVRDTGQPWSDDEEQHHAQEMFKRIWLFKFTPPGRGLWFMGTEAMEIKGGAALNNCGFVSTENIDQDFAEPFCVLMDYSMLGVGMGFDLRGAGRVTLVYPATSLDTHIVEDSREGWIECVRIVLNAFVGRGALPRAWDYSQIRKEGTPLKTFGGTASGSKPLEQLLTTLTNMLYSVVGQPISGKTITSIMNMIGKCVVAGNVRRSSEIALGDPEDTDFITLKDPTELNAMRARLAEIEKANPEWCALQKKIDKLRQKRAAKGLSVLDAEFAAIQAKIDKLEKKQKALLERDPAWKALNAEIDAHPLMSYLWASNNTALCPLNYNYEKLAASTVLNGEPGYAWLDVIRAYGRLIDPPDWKDQNAKGFNPCGEQTLHDMELCCLVETYPTRHENLDDYLMTLKYAYRYAKAVTLVPTHNKRTNAVMVRNRRIGTSMAGIIEQYSKLGLQECIRWWDAGYREICKWDIEYSSWLGVNTSIKRTSIKPGGTTPLLAGVEGGMKAPTARYYMRTVRFDYRSPLVKQLAKAGYRVEKDRTTPRTMVVYFPCKTKPGVLIAEELSLWEQAQIFTALQRYWSDNMVSATLTFQPHEANTLARLLKCFEGQWKCVSFLPLLNHGFLQAPYIPCTKEQYEEAIAKISEVDELTVKHDTDDKWCSGGICELPISQ